jgi:hypothetical protein
LDVHSGIDIAEELPACAKVDIPGWPFRHPAGYWTFNFRERSRKCRNEKTGTAITAFSRMPSRPFSREFRVISKLTFPNGQYGIQQNNTSAFLESIPGYVYITISGWVFRHLRNAHLDIFGVHPWFWRPDHSKMAFGPFRKMPISIFSDGRFSIL